MAAQPIEYFVDAAEAAAFLKVAVRRVKEFARKGIIPAHPLGEGSRKVWRFLLSELSEYMLGRKNGKGKK
jgi:hypothetical protein